MVIEFKPETFDIKYGAEVCTVSVLPIEEVEKQQKLFDELKANGEEANGFKIVKDVVIRAGVKPEIAGKLSFGQLQELCQMVMGLKKN